MKKRLINKNEKSYPTIGDLIKNKDYDYIEYRVIIPFIDEQRDIFAGAFKVKSGQVISIDGGIYDKNKKVIKSEEWSNPEKGIKNGITIIVNGGYV